MSRGTRAGAIQHGAPIAADAKSVTVAQLLETPAAGGVGVHVTFEGFAVPTDSSGRSAVSFISHPCSSSRPRASCAPRRQNSCRRWRSCSSSWMRRHGHPRSS